jgi:hypothetical protein
MAAQFGEVLQELSGQWLIFRRFFGDAAPHSGDAA